MQEAEHLKAEGNQCFKQKLYNKAVYFYTQALDLDPDNAVILANRAQVYLNLHKHEKAYMDTCGALQSDPGNKKAMFRKAVALSKLGLKGWARTELQRCVQANPENSEAQELLKSLQKEADASVVELTVFQRPEPLQSQQPLLKKELEEAGKRQ